jgi:hypothetical protein
VSGSGREQPGIAREIMARRLQNVEGEIAAVLKFDKIYRVFYIDG